MEHLLAVYGTLKTGNHNYMVHLSPKLPLHKGFFEIEAVMYTNRRYPMLVKSSHRSNIFVEIYQIDDSKLQEIDDLELPFGYHREKINLGKFENVWTYFYDLNSAPNDFNLVESGNFEAEIAW